MYQYIHVHVYYKNDLGIIKLHLLSYGAEHFRVDDSQFISCISAANKWIY